MKTKNFLMLAILGLCLCGCYTTEDNPVVNPDITGDIPGSGAPGGDSIGSAVLPGPEDPVPVPVPVPQTSTQKMHRHGLIILLKI